MMQEEFFPRKEQLKVKNHIPFVRPIYRGLLALFIFVFSALILPPAALASEECEETIGQTCGPVPYRAYPNPDPTQPKSGIMEFWPDEPIDTLSDGCSLVFFVNRKQEQLGIALQGACNDTTDVQAQNDCLAYLDNLARSFDENSPHGHISRSAARCAWLLDPESYSRIMETVRDSN